MPAGQFGRCYVADIEPFPKADARSMAKRPSMGKEATTGVTNVPIKSAFTALRRDTGSLRRRLSMRSWAKSYPPNYE